MKNFYVDVETTGLNRFEHGIFSLSCMIEEDNKIIETRTFKMNPDADYDEEALESLGITIEEIQEFEPQHKVFYKFVSFLDTYISRYVKEDKFHFIAYNAHFDSDFIREWFNKNGARFYGSYFWANVIDVMVLASYIAAKDREHLPNFKLETVCKAFDVKMGKAHTSEADVKATIELYRKIKNIIPIQDF